MGGGPESCCVGCVYGLTIQIIPSGFPTKAFYAPILSSPHATTISFFFTCSPEYLVGNTSHKAALRDMWCYIHKM